MHVFIDVHNVQARYIKTCQPHIADDHQFQRIVRVFEPLADRLAALLVAKMLLPLQRIRRTAGHHNLDSSAAILFVVPWGPRRYDLLKKLDADIHLFEEYTRYRDFKAFHYEQAVAFKRKLAETKAVRSGEKLSKSTVYGTLQALKRFFQWLALQSGYRSSLRYSDAQYFNLSEKDTRIATARREQTSPTIQQIEHVLHSMPRATDIEKRNRALIAFTLVTGARDRAIASVKLKHVDMLKGCFEQDAREVKTKFSKSFVTYFFPVGSDILQIVADWIDYLRNEKLWGNSDPALSGFESIS